MYLFGEIEYSDPDIELDDLLGAGVDHVEARLEGGSELAEMLQ